MDLSSITDQGNQKIHFKGPSRICVMRRIIITFVYHDRQLWRSLIMQLRLNPLKISPVVILDYISIIILELP